MRARSVQPGPLGLLGGELLGDFLVAFAADEKLR